MKKSAVFAFLLFAAVRTPIALADETITADVFGSPLTIKTNQRFAQAIYSLKWKHKEFLNSHDHGREMQTAATFDGFGECFNPTEAGTSNDATGQTSTSVPIWSVSRGNHLTTKTQMAFWLAPGAPYPNGCGGNPNVQVAQNTEFLSKHTIKKHVTIGFRGLENVIEYKVNYFVAEAHSASVFEALTGYMPPSFSKFWNVDLKTGTLTKFVPKPMLEMNAPVILSTFCKRYAMGVLAVNSNNPVFSPVVYRGYNFAPEHTTKWDAVFSSGKIAEGTYSFKIYVVVGSLAQVAQSMKQLHQILTTSN